MLRLIQIQLFICALASFSAGAELPVKAASWLQSGAVTEQVVGNTLNLRQSTNRAILHWDSFNIGPRNTVNFIQPGPGAAALNRIFDANPSVIQGQLNANGQIYLLNRNGIVFANGSQTNVHGIFASSHDVTDELFQDGILSAAFVGEAAFDVYRDAFDVPLESGDIVIERGAEVAVGSGQAGGFVRIFAPNIENLGSILAPDGQVVLAAGEKIYLAASGADDFFRGLVVEVEGGGEVANFGDVVAERGNASLIGLAINQQGRVSASSSVALNGSVRLMARELDGNSPQRIANEIKFFPVRGDINFGQVRTGKVTLGPNSVTEVVADTNDTTLAVDSQDIAPSRIEIQGYQVHAQSGSRIVAPAGEVSIDAVGEPGTFESLVGSGSSVDPVPRDFAARIQIDSGAQIDVAGNSAVVPMSRNALELELRGSQLRNSPAQLDGPLRGEAVTVDVRKGTPLADISAELEGIQRTYAERTTSGGDIVMRSAGEIRIMSGAQINLSAGSVETLPGAVSESILITADGRLVPISEADPVTQYQGVLRDIEVTHEKWRLADFDPTERYNIASWLIDLTQPGFTTGGDAGSLHLAAPVMVFEGQVLADTTRGEYQRRINEIPRGAELIVGLVDGIVAGQTEALDFLAPALRVGQKSALETELDFEQTVAEQLPELAEALVISEAMLSDGQFTRVRLFSNVEVVIEAGAPLNLDPGASVVARAPRVALNRSFVSPGGNLDFAARDINIVLPAATDPGVFIGHNLSVDVSGVWTNDAELLGFDFRTAPPIVLDGGEISFSSDLSVLGQGGVSIGNQVNLMLNAGSYSDLEGNLEHGKPGALTLAVNTPQTPFSLGQKAHWTAYGADEGGTLTLIANQVLIGAIDMATYAQGQSTLDGLPLEIPVEMFSDYGFQSIDIRANDGPLAIAPGVQINASLVNRFFDANAGSDDSLVVSGTALDSFTALTRLPAFERQAIDVTLAVDTIPNFGIFQDLLVATDAALSTDAGGRIHLWNNNGGSLIVDGQLSAPAGAITLELSGRANAALEPSPTYNFDRDRGLTLGPNAALITAGVTLLEPNDLNVPIGRVLDGGNIELVSNGFVHIMPGATLDASGTAATLSVVQNENAGITEQTQASSILFSANGGDIAIRSAEGGRLNGRWLAPAGGPGALGGSLTLEVTTSLRDPLATDGTFPTHARVIRVFNRDVQNVEVAGTDPAVEFFSGSVRFDAALDQAPRALEEFGVVDLDIRNVAAGGFSAVELVTSIASTIVPQPSSVPLTVTRPGVIEFQDSVNFSTDYFLGLNSPMIRLLDNIEVELNAPYLRVGEVSRGALNSDAEFRGTDGSASLIVQGDFVELAGSTALQGAGLTDIRSASDVRLRAAETAGEFETGGDLLIRGQVYTTTFSRYSVAAKNLTIRGQRDTEVLSAAGEVVLNASKKLLQGGVVKAPFGQIALNAPDIELTDGSLTSVSGRGLFVPGGSTEGSQTLWLYNRLPIFGDGTDRVPQKVIALQGDEIRVAAGAELDLRGGGQLQLHEFLPAPGGSASEDPLLAANSADTFAIVPNLAAAIAPFDAEAYSDYADDFLKPGQALEVTVATDVLDAGIYPLLPARYALLPGAVRVRRAPEFDGINAGAVSSFADGTVVVPGFTRYSGTSARAPVAEAYQLLSQELLFSSTDYLLTTATDFVTERAAALEVRQPRLPLDAGQLVLDVGAGLDLAGRVLGNGVNGGSGLALDLVSDRLALIGANGKALPGFVNINVNNITNSGAQSVLIGGLRSQDGNKLRIDVQSSEIVIDGSARLAGSELMFAASDEIRTERGSMLDTRGAPTGRQPFEEIVIDQAKLDGDGNQIVVMDEPVFVGEGAFVRLTTDSQVPVSRNHNDALPPAARGALNLEAGSTLAISGALTLDAVGPAQFDANFIVDGGSVGFSASRISLGEVAGRGISEGLQFSSADLRRLNASELILDSATTIDLYGEFTLSASNLVLNSAGLAGFDNNAKTPLFDVSTLSISNPASRDFLTGSPPDGTGTLQIRADSLISGDNDVRLAGFAAVSANLRENLHIGGSGSLNVDGAFSVLAPRVNGTDGGTLSLTAGGLINLAGGGAKPDYRAARLGDSELINDVVVNGSGVAFAARAPRITLNTRFDFPAGDLSFVTTDAGNALNVGANTVLDVSGTALLDSSLARALGDGSLDNNVLAYAPAGTVSLISQNGQLNVNSQAVLNLSGYAAEVIERNGKRSNLDFSAFFTDARAGGLDLFAGGAGSVSFAPRLITGSGSKANGASLTFVADQIPGVLNNLPALRRFHLRQRTGSINTVAPLEVLDLKLVADTGDITVSHDIDASGEQRQRVELLAGQELDIAAGVNIITAASGARRGGDIVLASRDGHITISSSASFDLDGRGGFTDGRLILRAARDGAGVRINPGFNANRISNARSIDIEAVQTENSLAALAGALTAADNYNTNNAAAIEQTLFGVGGDSRFRLIPVVDIAVDGDIDLNTAINLQPQTASGLLNLRASGDLNVNADISDGFRIDTVFDFTTFMFVDVEFFGSDADRDSWGLKLVSGAELMSADALAVKPLTLDPVSAEAQNNIVIAADTKVRTGNADIRLVASGDIELSANTSVVYTIGRSEGLELDRGVAFDVFPETPTKNIPLSGGDLIVRSGGDLLGPVAATQSIQEWYQVNDEVADQDFGAFVVSGSRAGTFLDFSSFEQNLASFGGGDLIADIGGNADRISFSVPTYVFLESETDGIASEGDEIVRVGTGDLLVNIGGDLTSAQLFVGDGRAEVDVRGAVSATTRDGDNGYAMFAVQGGEFNLRARRDIEVQAVVDPVLLRDAANDFAFVSYANLSSFRAVSTGGGVVLPRNFDPQTSDLSILSGAAERLFPATFELIGMGGDVEFARTIASFFPSETGNFGLLARDNVVFPNNSNLTFADTPSSQNYDVFDLALDQGSGGAPNADLRLGFSSQIRSDPPRRMNDLSRSFIVARDGSVLAQESGQVAMNFSEPIAISAGVDIRNIQLRATNLRDSDISSVTAGRDIRQLGEITVLEVAGPGQFHVFAGRNIELGESEGIVTVGNTTNPALSVRGADTIVGAGFAAEVDYDAFIQRYFVAADDVERDAVGGGLYADAVGDLNQFLSLPREQQLASIVNAFNTELRESGVEATTSGNDDYSRGFLAIDTLFPGERTPGDINLLFSRIHTIDGGQIDLLAPGGSINAGLAVAPTGAPQKEAGELGIVALAEGNINAYLRDDFLVNQSRVFTLGGGDIALFSRQGNIDAGRGAKSSLAVPSPRIVIDNNGLLTLDFSGAISGSGIRTISAGGSGSGSVFLFAPQGIVNAGEAGIAGESVFIGATEVIGANNIDVGGGVAVGVPSTSSVSVAASVAGAADAGAAAAQSATDNASQQSAAAAAAAAANDSLGGPQLSIISVEVLGFGG